MTFPDSDLCKFSGSGWGYLFYSLYIIVTDYCSGYDCSLISSSKG